MQSQSHLKQRIYNKLYKVFFIDHQKQCVDEFGNHYSLKLEDGTEIRDTFGHLLGDEPIPPKWESNSVINVLAHFPEAVERLKRNDYFEESIWFFETLYALQVWHDKYFGNKEKFHAIFAGP